jgi:outer membrane protein OmpA-like peptidoglycan-associated protein
MIKTIPLMQLSLVVGLALGTAACQSVSDAASGVGDTVSSAADSVGNAVSHLNPFGSDDDAAPPAGTMADGSAPSADTNAATTPDLSSIPARPTSSTPAQQQAAAQSLAADGAQARYSADSLRAGTEAAAAPPSAVDIAPPSAQASAAPPSANPPSANDAPPSASDAPPSAQPTRTAVAAPPPAGAPSAALSQGTAAVPTAGSPPPQVQTASLAPPSSSAASIPPGAEPAVPANAPMRGRGNSLVMGSQTMTDTALGFKPSTAPPLNASINQWVAAPVLARYRQTASTAGISLASNAAVPAKGAVSDSGAMMSDMGGPISSIAAMNGGVTPSAIVYFPGDGTTLSVAARNKIHAAVAQYKASGGAASIRVVGHAASRTANMPVERHLEVIFDKSQARANAVAQELIHEGVPAAKVLVEAVGDSQPVYYESMPQGEDGNRRAEIFVQS